jgi:hypothetical protein
MLLTLPFMVSALGFVSPAVSPTNLVGNLVAPAGGIYGFLKEKRMLWVLGMLTGAGAVAGSFIGPMLRVRFVADPALFKVVVGILLISLAVRLYYETTERFLRHAARSRSLAEKFSKRVKKIKEEQRARVASGLAPEAVVKVTERSFSKIVVSFWGEAFTLNPLLLITIGFLIGMVSSLIGVGGAFLLVPFCASVLQLPIYAVTGATILYSLITSAAGIVGYLYFTPVLGQAPVNPDWGLGLLFGAGGLVGGYLAARTQKYVPEKGLRYLLGGIVGIWGALYVLNYFFVLPIRV